MACAARPWRTFIAMTAVKDFQNSITVLFDAAQQDVFDTFIAMEVASLHEKLVNFGCESGTSLETLLTKDDILKKSRDLSQRAC